MLTDDQAKDMRAAVDASDTDAIRRINGTWPGARPSLGIIALAERVLTTRDELTGLRGEAERIRKCLTAAFADYCRANHDPDHIPEPWAEEAQELIGAELAGRLYDSALGGGRQTNCEPCHACGRPSAGPGDADCVNCDCGAVVCSSCCEAWNGESYCPGCAIDHAAKDVADLKAEVKRLQGLVDEYMRDDEVACEVYVEDRCGRCSGCLTAAGEQDLHAEGGS